jgi:hypothetical protein
MGKIAITFLLVHFLGLAVYTTVVDELYCQGDYQQKSANDCYGWKGAAGVWEIVLFQEFVVRPAISQ